jgi:hypothetical protein
MLDDLARLTHMYECFNARDLEAVLATMAPDVAWANGMEGGHLEGREAVRAYWTRQWALLDPTVVPERFDRDASGRVVLTVRQLVRDKAGALLADGCVKHAYTFKDGLVQRMDILPA